MRVSLLRPGFPIKVSLAPWRKWLPLWLLFTCLLTVIFMVPLRSRVTAIVYHECVWEKIVSRDRSYLVYPICDLVIFFLTSQSLHLQRHGDISGNYLQAFSQSKPGMFRKTSPHLKGLFVLKCSLKSMTPSSERISISINSNQHLQILP